MHLNKILIIVCIILFFESVSGQGYFQLAAHYAPVIWQDVVCTEYGDFITRVDYDDDFKGNNNWNNLGYPNKSRLLPAYVYYSVVETSTHYFICYALFHPADDFHCHFFSHENDLEGIIMTVQKDGTSFGKLRLVQLQAHNDFYQYTPPNTMGIEERNETLDDEIIIDYNSHPRVYIEGGGHGIRHSDTGGAPSVRYVYEGRAQDPDDVGYDNVGYDLLSIFSELWYQRYNCCGSPNLLDDGSGYSGRNYSYGGIGNNFDGDDGSDDAASTPWHWSDNDDNYWNNGDWFMDPAGYQYWQFVWDESFSIGYIIHPFLNGDIPDEIYNGKNGNTELSNGPYHIRRSVNVLTGQNLTISPGQTVYVVKGEGILAEGSIRIEDSIKMVRSDNSSLGIHGGIGCKIVISNYGGIHFK